MTAHGHNARVLNHVAGRLSLRPPQAESLAKLARALETAPELLRKDEYGGRDLSSILSTLQASFPTLQDFERDFPSLCFALATGVGKTRLMGAFIAYLHLSHGINNFFVLAPNLTVYNKLITDFTRNTPKYVFKGIAEFAQQAPLIITGDNYDQSGAVIRDQPTGFAHDVRINIFNISKVNSEMRGGKEPRVKRMREVLGDSYFDHLAALPDLVLLMDESHRYRASAGVRAINELQPLVGLELTATPFVESNRGPVAFKNVIMDYPLARAMADGFVKEPAVVTQRDFDAKAHSAEEIERIKLEDGIRLHETTKVELLTYARQNSLAPVKPFMLVIARDTTHAASLRELIEDKLFEGRYRDKVIQVDSSRSGAEEEEMITRLLAVESLHEPTEIVVHVNMLKEGWDVTNLYTIVPLRAANARTLIEQSIGRGLRLPYGKRTHVAAVDRLNIVAHDKFQEIIDEANRADSPLRLKQIILEAPGRDERKVSVQIVPTALARLGLMAADEHLPASLQGVSVGIDVVGKSALVDATPVFTSDADKAAVRVVLDVIGRLETRRDLVPNSAALLQPEVRQQIFAEAVERLRTEQGRLLEGADPNQSMTLDLTEIVARTTEVVTQQTIDIPRIAVVPKGEVTTGFHPFQLDVSQLNFQGGVNEIVIHNLHTNEQDTLAADPGMSEARPEDYIVHALMDFDDIDYFSHAELLYDLAGQVVRHLRGYLRAESAVTQVLKTQRHLIAREIHAQMMMHFWENATDYEVEVSRGFTGLKESSVTSTSGELHHYRETPGDLERIKQMLFGGFQRCLYPLQKFQSDSERRFAIILEKDALKWMKPAKGQFQIYYKLGAEQPEYVPDFVVETEAAILMAETKARKDLQNAEVVEKAKAAVRWCQHASEHAGSMGSKRWQYLLIPHDEIKESKRLVDFLRFEMRG